jgi:hypothetical protein
LNVSAIRLTPRTDVEIVCREPDGGYVQFDCRLLFLGARERELKRAYAEAVRLFAEIGDDAELAARLRASEEIRRLYEIGTDRPSLTMRDTWPPIFSARLGSPPAVFDIARIKFDAICCSHAHWDHCNPGTLLRFDKTRRF